MELGIFLLLYFTPAIVAGLRHHRNVAAIFMLNLLLGWTLIGWVAAFVWALTASVVPASERDAEAREAIK